MARRGPRPRTDGARSGGWEASQYPLVLVGVLLVGTMLAAVLIGLAAGGNAQWRAFSAIVPLGVALAVSDRCRRSRWSGAQRLIVGTALTAMVVITWIGIFIQPMPPGG